MAVFLTRYGSAINTSKCRRINDGIKPIVIFSCTTNYSVLGLFIIKVYARKKIYICVNVSIRTSFKNR